MQAKMYSRIDVQTHASHPPATLNLTFDLSAPHGLHKFTRLAAVMSWHISIYFDYVVSSSRFPSRARTNKQTDRQTLCPRMGSTIMARLSRSGAKVCQTNSGDGNVSPEAMCGCVCVCVCIACVRGCIMVDDARTCMLR